MSPLTVLGTELLHKSSKCSRSLGHGILRFPSRSIIIQNSRACALLSTDFWKKKCPERWRKALGIERTYPQLNRNFLFENRNPRAKSIFRCSTTPNPPLSCGPASHRKDHRKGFRYRHMMPESNDVDLQY